MQAGSPCTVGKVDSFQKQGGPEITHTSCPSGRHRRTTPSVPHPPETALLWLPALNQDRPAFPVSGSTWTNVFEADVQFAFLSPADHHLPVLVLLPLQNLGREEGRRSKYWLLGLLLSQTSHKATFPGDQHSWEQLQTCRDEGHFPRPDLSQGQGKQQLEQAESWQPPPQQPYESW